MEIEDLASALKEGRLKAVEVLRAFQVRIGV